MLTVIVKSLVIVTAALAVTKSAGISGKPLRWGIVGAGKISNDFVNAVSTLSNSDHTVVAIYDREASNAQSFAVTHKIPKAYDDLEKLATDPDVDVVYVGTINLVHFEHVKILLENKMPVLCEKPLTLNAKQTKALIDIAKSNNVFLMEAMWSRFTPAYAKIKSILDSGVLGDITHVSGSIGLDMSNVSRVMRADIGGGSTLDIGVYPLQFQQFVYRSQTPKRIQAAGKLNEQGADTEMESLLTYSRGQTANAFVSLVEDIPNDGLIVGKKGILSVPQHNCPEKLILHTSNGKQEEFDFPLPKSSLHYYYPNTIAFVYQAEAVRQYLMKGVKESPLMPLSDSLQLSEITDNIRKQIGVHYPADN